MSYKKAGVILKTISRLLKPYIEMIVSMLSVKQIKQRYGEQYNDDVKHVVVSINLKRIMPLSVIIGLFQIVFLILDNSTGFYQQNGSVKYVNFYSAIFLILCCIIFSIITMILITAENKCECSTKQWVYRIYYFCISLGLLAYIYSDLYRGNVSNTIFYMAVIFSLFPVFNMKEAVFFVTMNSVSVLTIMLSIQKGSVVNDVHMILILFTGWLLLFFLRANMYNSLFYQTNLQDLNHKLDMLAKIDPLTKLPNRRYLNEYVEGKIDEWKKFGTKVLTMMVDIDNFKNYNDTFSHLDGDDCLIAVSSSLRNTLQKFDGINSFVSRIGGEEFIIVVDGFNTKDKGIEICKQLRRSVEDMHMIAGSGSLYEYVTVSIGASIYDPAEQQIPAKNPIEAQYRLADYELYNAKKNGKNRISLEENSII